MIFQELVNKLNNSMKIPNIVQLVCRWPLARPWSTPASARARAIPLHAASTLWQHNILVSFASQDCASAAHEKESIKAMCCWVGQFLLFCVGACASRPSPTTPLLTLLARLLHELIAPSPFAKPKQSGSFSLRKGVNMSPPLLKYTQSKK